MANLAERGRSQIQPIFVKRRIGADAGRRAILGRAIIIGGNQPGRAIAAHLQRQFPFAFHRLADHRGQQAHFGHQRLDHRGIGMLLQHPVQHAVQPRHPAANIATVKLKGQNGVVPCDTCAEGHADFLNWSDMQYRAYMGAASNAAKGI